MRTRTALAAAAIPAFLLLSACGGGNSDDDAASPAPSRTTAAPSATPSATPSASASANPAEALTDKVAAQLRQGLTAAHLAAPDQNDSIRPCDIGITRIYKVDKDHPKTRERVVASLTAAGWKTAVGGGGDDSHLTGNDWDAFVSRTKVRGQDGKPYEMLSVTASCIDHTADDLFNQ